MNKVLFAVAIAVICLPAQADIFTHLPSSKDCAAGSAIAMAECLSQKQRALDESLPNLVGMIKTILMKRLDAQGFEKEDLELAKQNLTEQLNQFIPLLKQYRENACALQGQLESGDDAWVNVWTQSCELDFTVEQARIYQRYILIK